MAHLAVSGEFSSEAALAGLSRSCSYVVLSLDLPKRFRDAKLKAPPDQAGLFILASSAFSDLNFQPEYTESRPPAQTVFLHLIVKGNPVNPQHLG